MDHAPATPRLDLADHLGLAAIVGAGVVAALGLTVPDLYRDRPILIEATRADNLVQLALLPVALIAYLRRGTPVGRVALIGIELYLAYFFGLYAIAAVVGWATLLEIAVFGLAVWALVLGLPATDTGAIDAILGPRVLRRTTIGFLVLVAGFHIPLWTAQVVGSAASGALPAALVSFGWLNTPVYAFDLAFALPLGLVAAAFLARHDQRGTMLALGFAWFSALLALDMFVEQLWFGAIGDALDLSQALPFGMILLLSALVIAPTLIRRPHALATLAVAATHPTAR
ncbi:MAG: hypothetical protein MUE82_05235 [Chloroflexi bacterium]|nr:hypothetical protein [Chloroflexota bacterium]